MLKRLRLKNFRSCVDTEIEFEPITLLIGQNNVGKSNICKALRFLSACPSPLQLMDGAAAQAGMSPSEVVTRSEQSGPVEFVLEGAFGVGAVATEFRYELTLWSAAPSRELQRILGVDREALYLGSGAGLELVMERERNEGVVYSPPTAGGKERTQGRFPCSLYESGLFEAISYPAVRDFIDYLESWRYHSMGPALMRDVPVAARLDALIRGESLNLASVLFTLKNEDARRFQMLLELVREIEPGIYTLNFIRPRPEEVWMEVEDTDGSRYGPESLSDGTLNYMTMCYVALQSQIVTHRDVASPGLVCLEEPENGLWVGHLRRLFGVLQEGGAKQQMILTTHNPYLIDLFEDHLEQVRLVKRGGLGLHEGTTVDAPDATKVGKLLETFSLGEQYFRGLLE